MLVVFCLSLACLFWTFRALTKEYETYLSYPVTFKYNSKTLVPTSNLPDRISFYVKGTGWELIKRTMGLKQPDLVFPIGENPFKGEILAYQWTRLFKEQISDIPVVSSVSNATFVEFAPISSTTVQIKPVINEAIAYKGLQMINEPIIEPKSIEVFGPKPTIKTLVDTIKIRMNNSEFVEGTNTLTVSLSDSLLPKGCSFKKKEVSVQVQLKAVHPI
jgi:hypothetical protein